MEKNNPIKKQAILSNGCPNGGTHSPGSSGEWIGRCTKCGQPC